VPRLAPSMEHPVPDFHAHLAAATKKPGLRWEAGLRDLRLKA
jgi:hypothetical protein